MPSRFTEAQIQFLDRGVAGAARAAVSVPYAHAQDRRFDDYCTMMRASGEEPLPFSYKKVARLFFFVFISRPLPCAASIKHYSAALTRAARRLEIPFCSEMERERLKELKKGLRRLSVPDVRKALALVLALLLRLMAVSISSLADVQWCARASAAHAAMLRMDDHGDDSDRAMLLSSVKRMPSRSFTYYVGEGKNDTRGLQPAVLWNSLDAESPGYWMEHWLHRSGAAARPQTDLLWPLVRPDGVVDWSKPAPAKAFVAETKRRARIAGMANEAIARITGHSFRAGGVTDLLLAGFSADFIMAQGRWRSAAYQVYFRMSQASLAGMSAKLMVAMATRTAAYLDKPAAAGAAARRLFA